VKGPLSAALQAEFRHGIALFNAGRYWDAHEAWETVWNAVEGDERLFYQGLIQAAAAMVHRQKSNAHGVRVLGTKALEKLARFDRDHGGIDVERFRRDVLLALSGGDWPRIVPAVGD